MTFPDGWTVSSDDHTATAPDNTVATGDVLTYIESLQEALAALTPKPAPTQAAFDTLAQQVATMANQLSIYTSIFVKIGAIFAPVVSTSTAVATEPAQSTAVATEPANVTAIATTDDASASTAA